MSLKAMQYEDMPLKVSKRVRDTDIKSMSSWAITGYLVKKHKFGLLLTFTIVYVSFSLVGTLIVGLVESL